MFAVLKGRDIKTLEHFVERYFLLTKSKMENSPTVGQDIKEGYDRHVASYKADLILDSLKYEQVSHYLAGIRHFKKIDKIRDEVSFGNEFKLYIRENKKPNFNVNYFSTLKD
tara:strand:- start:49 stop:384 length:336 start_codon:yes stop_codon:yes gene_type:complete